MKTQRKFPNNTGDGNDAERRGTTEFLDTREEVFNSPRRSPGNKFRLSNEVELNVTMFSVQDGGTRVLVIAMEDKRFRLRRSTDIYVFARCI